MTRAEIVFSILNGKSWGGGNPMPILPRADSSSIVSNGFAWFRGQDIDLDNIDQYDNGLKLLTDRINGFTATQETQANRPTTALTTANDYANRKLTTFDGSNDFLLTNLDNSYITNEGFEIHIWTGGLADGIIATFRTIFGAQDPVNTNSRIQLSIPSNSGRLTFAIGNPIDNTFARYTTNTNVFADGVNNKRYIRVRVHKTNNNVSFYSIAPNPDYRNVITSSIALDDSQTLPLSNLDFSNHNLSIPAMLGALNSNGTPVGHTGFNLLDFVITPLLSNDEANALCNYIVNWRTEVPNYDVITTTNGEVFYAGKNQNGNGYNYEVIARRMQQLPTVDYPSELFYSNDLLNFVEYNNNPVFDLNVTYSYFRGITKLPNGTYVGAYTTKPNSLPDNPENPTEDGGYPVTAQEDIGIATSNDLITWNDLGVVLPHGSFARVFPGQIRFENGTYYLLVNIPEVDDDVNDQYEVRLYTSSNLTDWVFSKILVPNSGASSGAMSSISPGGWIKRKGIWYLFFIDAFGSPQSRIRVAWSYTIDGDYTVLDTVIEDFWIGHPITPGGGSGEETNMTVGQVFYDSATDECYIFYNFRDQTVHPIPAQLRRVRLFFDN